VGCDRTGGEPGFDFINLLLQPLGRRRNALCFLQIIYDALQIALAFFPAREIHCDLFEHKSTGIFVSSLLLAPTAQAQFPDIASTTRIVVVLSIEATKGEENFGAVRISTKTFTEELLGFIDFAQPV